MKKKKRPYQKPTLRTEKVFERKSLACGKASPASRACILNLKQS
ncbi:MAG TPA: hypothetical protein VKW04_20070 [Planctomycetota bacterium]|nr:hypothetical protein [Planctomycetota bacterium]